MGLPFDVTTPGVGVVYSIDSSGNMYVKGNTTHLGNLTVQGTITAASATTGTVTGVFFANGGVNTAAGVNVITPSFALGTIGTQLTDTTRDYMVYLTTTTAGTINLLSIGSTSAATSATIAIGTAQLGSAYDFRLPAGWFVRITGTTAAFVQTAVSC